MKTNMRIFDTFDQGSLEWQAVRAGVVTASAADALFTPKFAIKEGKAVDTYLSEVLAEKWLGAALPNFLSRAMEDGHIIEAQARSTYQFIHSEEIRQVAFIGSDDMSIGCSPDGIIGKDKGFELKCPQADTHVKYLLANKVPDEYIVQVHFSMFVTGFKEWVFMSYRHGFHDFIKVVDRDEKIIETIHDGVDDFLVRLKLAYDCLVALNDGEPPPPNGFRQDVLDAQANPQPPKPAPAPIGNDFYATA